MGAATCRWWTIKDSEPIFAPFDQILSCCVGANGGASARALLRKGSSRGVIGKNNKGKRKAFPYYFGGHSELKSELCHRGLKLGALPHVPDLWGRQLAAGGACLTKFEPQNITVS